MARLASLAFFRCRWLLRHRVLRGPNLKEFRPGATLTKDRLDIGQSFFHWTLFQSAQENTRQIAHRIGHTWIKLTAAEAIDRIRQQIGNLFRISQRMVCSVWRQHCGCPAPVDASGASGSVALRCFIWVVKDAKALAGLRVGAAAFAILLPEPAFPRHRFSRPYLGRGIPPGIPPTADEHDSLRVSKFVTCL